MSIFQYYRSLYGMAGWRL